MSSLRVPSVDAPPGRAGRRSRWASLLVVGEPLDDRRRLAQRGRRRARGRLALARVLARLLLHATPPELVLAVELRHRGALLGSGAHQAPTVLERLDVGGGRPLRALLCLVAHLGALGQRLEAAALDRLVMDEQVLAGLVRRDEAEALLVVEPLHGSCGHRVALRG